MKKIFTLIVVSLMAAMTCQAEELQVSGIDYVNAGQRIDLDTCDVYIVPVVYAEKKNNHQAAKQQAAFDELGKTILSQLKGTYRKASYKVIDDVKEAPAGATIIEACLKEIDWGSGALRQVVGFGAGSISGRYNIKVSNASGLVVELENRRIHDTTFSSAKGAAVIKVYNKAMANDLIEVLRKIK